MEVQTAIAQIVPALCSGYKCFEGSVDANHNRVRYYNDHHVSQSDCGQVGCIIHICDEKHAYLVLYLNQKETKDSWN